MSSNDSCTTSEWTPNMVLEAAAIVQQFCIERGTPRPAALKPNADSPQRRGKYRLTAAGRELRERLRNQA